MANLPRVLLADQDVHSVEVIEPAMKNLTELVVARSTDEALALLSGSSWDVVLAAADVPGQGGVWLLEQVSQSWPGSHRVLLSGPRPGNFAELVRAGVAQDLLRKPTIIEQLMSVVLGGPVTGLPTKG
jgi:DNA-binding NtrC family response regulator